MVNGYGVILGCDKNVLELVAMVAKLCIYNKNYRIIHFKRVNTISQKILSVKDKQSTFPDMKC